MGGVAADDTIVCRDRAALRRSQRVTPQIVCCQNAMRLMLCTSVPRAWMRASRDSYSPPLLPICYHVIIIEEA
jgi:hypothetical protein